MAKPELLTHVKFGRFIRALQLRRYEALGLLEALWQHCWSVSSDEVGTAGDVAWIVDWPEARADQLAAALVTSGFLDPHPDHDDEFRVHDLWRHAPTYARRRLTRELSGEKDKLGSQTSDPIRSEPRKSSAAGAALSTDFPQAELPNVRVLSRLCHELTPGAHETWSDVADALKHQAARHRVAYDGRSVTSAISRVARGRQSRFRGFVQ